MVADMSGTAPPSTFGASEQLEAADLALQAAAIWGRTAEAAELGAEILCGGAIERRAIVRISTRNCDGCVRAQRSA